MSKVTEDAGTVAALQARAEREFEQWQGVADLVDECIDLMLNHRQSGHPGGSRSKVHALVATLLSGAMRGDLLRPWPAVLRPVRALRRAHGSAHLRDTRDDERDREAKAPGLGGRALRVPRRRPV